MTARKPVADVDLPDDTPPSGDREDPPATSDPNIHPALIGHHQMRVLMSLFKRHGISTDVQQYDWLTLRLGREVTSRKDITVTEAAHLLHELDTIPVPEPGSLARALVAVQAELPFVAKNRKATIEARGGGSYQYTYADLGDVTQAALPLLTKHGLAFSCCPREASKGYELVGVLMHESGETREGALPLYGNDAQALGGSLTYHRRYLLGCMIGLVTDDDADARQAMGSTATQPQDPPPLGPQVDPDLAAMGTPELLLEVDRYAVQAGQTFEEFTRKQRADWGNMSVSAMDDIPPDGLAPYVQRIRNYVNAQATP